jgi:hypothetical protein
MKKILLFVILIGIFPSVIFAADNDFTIKLKGFPVDGIEWGSSPQQLKIKPNDLECEHIKPSKEECSEFGVCGESEECFFDVKHNDRLVSLVFENDKLTYLIIRSKPTDFSSEVSYYSKSIGFEPSKELILDFGKYFWKWVSLYQDYKLTCEKNTSKCTFSVSPTLYTDISIKPPAKEKLKLLDITLGYSTSNDFTQIANSNKWKWFKLENYNIYDVWKIGIDGVYTAEFEFVDDKLKSITYYLDSKKVAENYLSILKKKYGNPEKDAIIDNYWNWAFNKNTRDEIRIGLSCGKKQPSITYTYEALDLKEFDAQMKDWAEKQTKKEKLFEKAF